MSLPKNAIISASSKDGLANFGKFLIENGYVIYATSGTNKLLIENGIESHEVSELTRIPEMFNGRLKTLSSYLLGGVLAEDRDDPELIKNGMKPIDLVMVSLYDFIGEFMKGNRELVEYIDIGGVTLLRSAAKNFQRVIVVPGNEYMNYVMENMKNGEISAEGRRYLASLTFHITSYYDYVISEHFGEIGNLFNLGGKKILDLRYGENPHQKAAAYGLYTPFFSMIKEGKEISYNNILDAWNAWELVNRLEKNSCVVVKHNTPCGAATGENPLLRAYNGDEVSAYGGVIACNYEITGEEAQFLSNKFIEVIIAEGYNDAALKILSKKKNLRILKGNHDYYRLKDIKVAGNIILVQNWNEKSNLNYEILSGNSKNEKLISDLKFGWEVSKSLRSNSIVLVKDLTLLSSGSGQPNRVDAVEIALKKAQKLGRIDADALLISDGFFPFPDSLQLIDQYGIKNVAAPMGSIRDSEVLSYAVNHGITFIKINERSFKH